jgi:hypothetical protein
MDSSLEVAELAELEEDFDESEYHRGVEFEKYCCVEGSRRW